MQTPNGLPPSLVGWQTRTLHTITCPSGQRIKIRLPGIGTLLEQGDLPGELVELALLELTQEGGAAGALAARVDAGDVPQEELVQRIRRFAAFQKHLVKAAVTEVETAPGVWDPVALTDHHVAVLPEDDLAMVSEIVQRLRAYDAKGVRIGVEPLNRWAEFCAAHGCEDTGEGAEGCQGCQTLQQRFSSVDVGGV